MEITSFGEEEMGTGMPFLTSLSVFLSNSFPKYWCNDLFNFYLCFFAFAELFRRISIYLILHDLLLSGLLVVVVVLSGYILNLNLSFWHLRSNMGLTLISVLPELIIFVQKSVKSIGSVFSLFCMLFQNGQFLHLN